MNRDDIIRMAREAGFGNENGVWRCIYVQLTEFADLVAAAEREECAKVCEGERWTAVTANVEQKVAHNMAIEDCAAAIRARGQE